MSDFVSDNTPFFILGCVRSGTTMLRDLLRLHPRLECPEETHFYRWADPYGSPRYERPYITMRLFKRHRRLDGIEEQRFHDMRRKAKNRKEIMQGYGALYLDAVGNPQGRWFDKTPQHIYGIFLLGQDFPEAKFIHIHRDPLNVVASLVEGKVMARHSVEGAVNYWNESLVLMGEYKKLYPQRVLEISYEAVTSSPEKELEKICDYLQEDFKLIDTKHIHVHPEKNKYKNVLSGRDIELVKQLTGEYAEQYGYSS